MDGRRGNDWKRNENSRSFFIGEGARIGAGSVIEPYSIIGKNSVVSSYSHLQKSIIFANAHIGKYCELLETTIGEHTMVEDDVTLFQKAL